MTARLQALELYAMQQTDHNVSALENDTVPIATVTRSQPGYVEDATVVQSNPMSLDFTEDLASSWVYRRARAFERSRLSAISTSVRSIGWSYFSHLSMAEVSDISVVYLAVTKEEIHNFERNSQTWSSVADDAVRPAQSPNPRPLAGPSQMVERLEYSEDMNTKVNQQHVVTVRRMEKRYDSNIVNTPKSMIAVKWRGGGSYIGGVNAMEIIRCLQYARTAEIDGPFVPRLCNSCGQLVEEGKVFYVGKSQSYISNSR